MSNAGLFTARKINNFIKKLYLRYIGAFLLQGFLPAISRELAFEGTRFRGNSLSRELAFEGTCFRGKPLSRELAFEGTRFRGNSLSRELTFEGTSFA
jgi:hypothetical protein